MRRAPVRPPMDQNIAAPTARAPKRALTWCATAATPVARVMFPTWKLKTPERRAPARAHERHNAVRPDWAGMANCEMARWAGLRAPQAGVSQEACGARGALLPQRGGRSRRETKQATQVLGPLISQKDGNNATNVWGVAGALCASDLLSKNVAISTGKPVRVHRLPD
jgi:hypothetical protein